MFPSRSVDLVGFMTDLGYDPSDTSVDTTTPRGSATWPPGPCWTSATTTASTSSATATAAPPAARGHPAAGGPSSGSPRPAGFNLVAGSDTFKLPLSVTVAKGRSTIEPGLVPAKNLTLTFQSFTDGADPAGMSRRHGGIHLEQSDLNGRTLGAQIGSQAWVKAQTYFNGTAA